MSKFRLLKQSVHQANLDVKKSGLVLFTWGNVSACDRHLGVVAIKPSGVPYDQLQIDDIVVVDLDGLIVEGSLKPSVDLPTHLEIYRQNKDINGITHTHSTYATAWAQKGRAIPIYGTTHADYFATSIPCARSLVQEEMENYELATGVAINEIIIKGQALHTPGAIVAGHGVFAFGRDAKESVYHATVLEEIARIAYLTETLPGPNKELPKHILEKHYERKHGKNATYGQKK